MDPRGQVEDHPDGTHFIYIGKQGTGEAAQTLAIASIEPGFVPRYLTPSDTNAFFVNPGLLLFVTGGILMQQPFDLERLQLVGEPTPVVSRSSNCGRNSPSRSSTPLAGSQPPPGVDRYCQRLR